jgi:Smg protein
MNEAFEAYNTARSMRVMGPHERARFTPDAWGHLVKLSRSGMLNTIELEHVIERALLQIDGRISVTDIRGLLSDSGLDDGDSSDTPITVH